MEWGGKSSKPLARLLRVPGPPQTAPPTGIRCSNTCGGIFHWNHHTHHTYTRSKWVIIYLHDRGMGQESPPLFYRWGNRRRLQWCVHRSPASIWQSQTLTPAWRYCEIFIIECKEMTVNKWWNRQRWSLVSLPPWLDKIRFLYWTSSPLPASLLAVSWLFFKS